MIDEHFTNKKLEREFGAQDNLPNFRLARTNEQHEFRRHPVTHVLERLPKYSYLPRGYWAIERLLPVDGPNAEMLPGIKYSYEPIFVFRNPRNDEPIPVVEDIVMALVHSCLFMQKKQTNHDWDAEEAAFYQKQVDRAYEFISDECSVMSTQLHLGEAVVKGEAKVG